MSWLTQITIMRGLVFARRGVRALESLAESHATLAHLAEADDARRHPPKRKPLPIEYTPLNVEEANARWQLQLEARRDGLPEPTEADIARHLAEQFGHSGQQGGR